MLPAFLTQGKFRDHFAVFIQCAWVIFWIAFEENIFGA
jgi:hypothetical protein